MPVRLSDRSLSSLDSGVRRPAYARADVKPGIVHLGVGAFHRAHQAVYVDDCLAAGDVSWGIVGASLRSPQTRDALATQDGLYTLCVRGGAIEELRVIGSLHSLTVAPEDPGALLSRLADPLIRIVTLTVTEKAYLRDPSGDLDLASPEIAFDLANPGLPATVHGFLVEAVARRRVQGAKPFTILSCDNLPANGATLRRLLVQYAQARDPDLARFIAGEVACPSSMVDRIVPATTDADRERIAVRLGLADAWPVVTEPFCQWVVEDRFPAGRPDWEPFGVTMTKDVRPFEDMKLRLLNGAHSAIAYLGLLGGHETVAAAFGDPAIRAFVDGLWTQSIPTLDAAAGLDPHAYTTDLCARFANAALAHRTAQIANDGSQKLPQRIVAPALERLAAGAPAGHLAFVVAAWIEACADRRSGGLDRAFTDPLDGPLSRIALSNLPAREGVAAVFEVAGFAGGDPHRERLIDLTGRHLQTIRERGFAAALALQKEDAS